MIEFAALLLVAALFGGMMLHSFGFAPMVFSVLPAEDAGRFIRAVFPWYYLFVIATAGFGDAILLLSNSPSGALAFSIAASAIYARQVLMPRINAARDEQLQGDAEAKRRFGRLHGISVALNFLQLFRARIRSLSIPVTPVHHTGKLAAKGARIGDRASVQAATRVNAEQASKRSMCGPMVSRHSRKVLDRIADHQVTLGLHRSRTPVAAGCRRIR